MTIAELVYCLDCWLDDQGISVQFLTAVRQFSANCADQLLGPPGLLFSGYRGGGGSGRVVKLTNLQLVWKLIMVGATPPLPHLPSTAFTGTLYLLLYKKL
jgi:hypothetical protein